MILNGKHKQAPGPAWEGRLLSGLRLGGKWMGAAVCISILMLLRAMVQKIFL